MKHIATQLPVIRLVGIVARTNNAAEMNPAIAKIGNTIQFYFQNQLPEKMKNRKNPGTTYSVYTEYESDFTRDYTYFIGEEVTSFEGLSEGFEKLTIPAQDYIKFTNGPQAMPDVSLDVWRKVWKMRPDEFEQEFGGPRAYRADFEVYDQRALDPQSTVVDVYVGIINMVN